MPSSFSSVLRQSNNQVAKRGYLSAAAVSATPPAKRRSSQKEAQQHQPPSSRPDIKQNCLQETRHWHAHSGFIRSSVMAAEQRKLLEQLMGADNLVGTGAPSRNAQLSITDPKVCRSYLAGTCPHDLFTNTKQDLGPCPKTHSEGLKTEYETASASEKAKWGFEFDYMRDMQRYIDDCDRRIESAQRRLEKTPDEIRQTNNLLKQISDLSKTINTGLLEVSVLGETGSVALALNELHKTRTAKHQKETCERELKNLQDTSGPSGHQKLQVCDVCGAYLSRLDNDRRLADHFFGKMHMGYSDMRKGWKKLSEELKGRPPPVRHHEDEDGGGWGGGGRGGRGPRYGGGGYRKRGRW